MKTKRLLLFYLSTMLVLFLWGLVFPQNFTSLLKAPQFYVTAKFFHILCVTLFFGNAVIGMLWETRSLLSGKPEIVRFTYQTVVWMDAVFTAPLIIISVVSGIMLGTILGGVWTIGWISLAFILFFVSGAVWILADIPTQYKINQLFQNVEIGTESLPSRLTRLLWYRLGISICGTLPLLTIFFLMVHKPEITPVAKWFR